MKAPICRRREGNNEKITYQDDGRLIMKSYHIRTTKKALISGRWEGNNKSSHIRTMGGCQ